MKPSDLKDLEMIRHILVKVLQRHRAHAGAAPVRAPTRPPPATPAGAPAPKARACRRCGAPITWGLFHNGKAALIEPASLSVGFTLLPGRFGPVPRFDGARGHRLHHCAGGGR